MSRLLRCAGLAAIVLAVASGPAGAGTSGIGFTSMPGHVVQGTAAHVGVRVHFSGACALSVHYSGGSVQTNGFALSLKAVSVGMRAWDWHWTVPTSVQAGAAKATVRCTGIGAVTKRFVVVGRLDPAAIVVGKSGFSTRVSATGSTRLSYGVILHNSSPSRDATQVTVQTNFVLADEHLLGTDTRTVQGIPASGDFAVGNTVSFPGAAPIVRLEVVVRVGSWAPHTIHLPTLANIHLVPNLYDLAWLGSIEGELQNTDAAQTLRSATLSAVVLDASGNIIGGTNGFLMQTLPPGARSYLKLSGVDPISSSDAVSAIVSMAPSWGTS